ncbi:hypothetical protein KP77_11560 [Jeotgalibacillus alimentarius]|uniref:Uncharacterized protein n=1 Tax=Jeotgalibacillus alimentarius TaxID=135826 RepID=A0A0C2SCF8_9BACL|nr:hypothetical protein [Jeotgalibacillus alimentarius]KIL51644.1 hypothetical protein KP77_11560 [Jeotgalibacillus alimentarius]
MKVINPAAAAIVMAMGIFLFGASKEFTIINKSAGILTVLLLLLFFIIYGKLAWQLTDRTFRQSFFRNPVNVFVSGAWIAGIAVMCNVLIEKFSFIEHMIKPVAFSNFVFYLSLLPVYIISFVKLYQKRIPVHGVVLLSAVGMQSLVILWVQLLGTSYSWMTVPMQLIGLVFYASGALLIGERYLLREDWNLIDDWTNTNCIVHGALSITGVAGAYADTLSAGLIDAFWLIVLIIFIGIEVIEITRAKKRVAAYGFSKGLFSYHVTQWSRNFTFGMFFVFTAAAITKSAPAHTIDTIQVALLPIIGWVVLSLLIMQFTIWFRAGAVLK